MKITGTIFEITKKHNGEIFTNILDPKMDASLFGTNSCSGYYILERMLTYVRQRNGFDIDNARNAMKRLVYQTINDINTGSSNVFNYGVTWNFKSVITDETLRTKITDYITTLVGGNSDLKTKIDEIEDKAFTYEALKTKTQRAATTTVADENGDETVVMIDVETVKNAIDKSIKFFSEFDFEPNFRFLNTMSRVGSGNNKAAKDYIMNYFKLIDSPYINDIAEKMKSVEFEEILNVICNKNNTTQKTINKRFDLYYGSQGTGKTTEAMKLANGKAIVCHSAMLPSDLMEDFGFDDGKATFHPSALCKAMENGEPIVLDEINLLPFESLRFLQGILDGKQSIIFKGHEIKIADGFKIIGTMNLSVNGMTYALPSPIVDRCSVIKEFKLTASQLVNSII